MEPEQPPEEAPSPDAPPAATAPPEEEQAPSQDAPPAAMGPPEEEQAAMKEDAPQSDEVEAGDRESAEAQCGEQEEAAPPEPLQQQQQQQQQLQQQQQQQQEEGAEEEEDGIPSIISSLAELNRAAMGYLRRGQTAKALKQMDRAAQVCELHEQAHPALAVETARVRLNLSAALSAGGQHLEALSAIKDAQRGLANVLAWADDCDGEDPGVAAIASEARALECAALVAEGIQLESSGPGVARVAIAEPRVSGLHAQLYDEATSLGERRLPGHHPVVALARRLRAESAVCAPGAGGGGAAASAAASTEAGSSRVVLPRVSGATAGSPTAGDVRRLRRGSKSRSESSPAAAANPPPPPAVWQEPGEDSPSQVDSTRTQGDAGGGAGADAQKKAADAQKAAALQKQRSLGRSRSNVPPKRAEGKKDIFQEFLRDQEAEKFSRMQGSEMWQEDARKRLGHIHKFTRLSLEQSPDDELKEKRYSYNGHKVMMQTYMKENRSRSDGSLVREARKAGIAPEVLQVRKYNKDLYVKPPTPPPAAAPPPKPVIDESIASLFRPKRATSSPIDF